jgi:NAD(P)-dependent dehydrogenase (short-subunit alcohol dehydrogenase family)
MQTKKNIFTEGKVPPQELEIEQVVLGAIMLESSCFRIVKDKLRPDMFYKNAHQLIYGAIISLENQTKNIDIVVWAQGHNFNDNIDTLNITNFEKMINGNVGFILTTLNFLLNNNKIMKDAKMVIVSSIWENFSRENKLSYSITKAALSGLVKNVAVDLSKKNILINNILPGVIDNEMSRKTLSEEEINYIKNYMYFGRLITLEDVFKTTKFLVLENTGITGQSITIDLGFTNVRKYK